MAPCCQPALEAKQTSLGFSGFPSFCLVEVFSLKVNYPEKGAADSFCFLMASVWEPSGLSGLNWLFGATLKGFSAGRKACCSWG